MMRRMIWLLVAVTLVLGAIGSVKYLQIQAAVAAAGAFQPPPEAVTTLVARQVDWQTSLNAIGTVTAVHGVTVSADLPGIVAKIAFESGAQVTQGDLLVELDVRQELAQLASAAAQRDLTRANLGRIAGLRSRGVSSQAEYDAAVAEAKRAEAGVEEIRAAIERKTIRAPFTGFLGIRQVNLGQYLTGGDPVVPLQSLDPIYVDFSLPQQEVGRLKEGTAVRVSLAEKAEASYAGRITAVDSVVDEATRNVKAQATLSNPGGTLRPGMFVRVEVDLPGGAPTIALPASSINYAPYGDSVFIVEPMEGPDGREYLGVRQQFVKLGAGRGDQVAVLTGVEPGQQVVTSGVFKLRNGGAVAVSNGIQPSNDPAPDPEDS